MALCLAVPAMAQMSGGRGKAEATVNGKTITIDYGRPSLQGRDMLSQAQPGMVWRLGMNQATQIETTGELMIAGKTLPAGKYTLWAKKVGDKSWVLAFHPKTGIWGAPELKEGFVAELPLTMGVAKDSAEQLTISLSDMKGKAGIQIQWGTALLSGSFGVK
jgi:hypothetical protein